MSREEILKIAKSILFNTEMVRAILEGRKSVTRRVIKYENNQDKRKTLDDFIGDADPQLLIGCSPYQIGDILYVRETWCEYPENKYYYRATSVCDGKSNEWGCKDAYDYTENCNLCEFCNGHIKWRSSNHMPKTAARIFLKVIGVRVGRLQEMTNIDCHKEGVCVTGVTNFGKYFNPRGYDFGLERFEVLWDSTIKKTDTEKYRWQANPWVWVIGFERIEEMDNEKICKWLHDDVCVNDSSDECADFPAEEVCKECKYFEGAEDE